VNNPDSYASEAATSPLQTLERAGFYDADAEAAYRAFFGRLYAPHAGQGLQSGAGRLCGRGCGNSQRRVQLVSQNGGRGA
jgi:hypothetical protein